MNIDVKMDLIAFYYFFNLAIQRGKVIISLRIDNKSEYI